MNRIVHCVSLLAVALSIPSAAAEGLEGRYVFVSAASSDVNAAIETAVAKMNFIKRPIARSRLKKTNPVYQQLSITSAPNGFTIAFDDRRPVTAPTDGTVVKWTREDGEVFDVTMRVQGNTLVETFKAEDGARENSFRIEPDGALTLNVVLTSDQLPEPVKYSLRYRRSQ